MTIAEQISRAKTDYDEVYEAGYAAGSEQGGGDGWSAFWDFYQCNGERVNYNGAFAENSNVNTTVNGEKERTWSKGGCTPKYKIQPTNTYRMFSYFGGNSNNSTNSVPDFDLKKFFADNNWDIDFTKVTTSSYCFEYSPIINCPAFSMGNGFNTFYNCKRLKTIDKLIFNPTQTSYTTPFANCLSLQEIYEIEGEINGSISFAASTILSKETLLRIINALKTTTSTKTLTLSTTYKLTDEEIAIATQKGWTISG